jgi:predicted secreted Zn-dependent protease
MWRRSSQELAAALSSSSSSKRTQPIHLQGPTGAGKSIAVVQLVEWARNNGWWVEACVLVQAQQQLCSCDSMHPAP